MSGARGTAGQQQDRRNAADRAGHSRGTAGQQQDRRNAATAQRAGNVAPGVERSFNPKDPVRGTPPTNMRRVANPTAQYDLNMHNIMELRKPLGMLFGGVPSMIGGGIGALTGVESPMPNFTGYRGQIQGPGDYDPSNRFATTQAGKIAQLVAQQRLAAPKPAPIAPNPFQQLQSSFVPRYAPGSTTTRYPGA